METLIIFLPIFVVGFIIMAVMSSKNLKRHNVAMQELADRYGLDTRLEGRGAKTLTAYGAIDGFDVTISVVVVRSGKNATTYTQIELESALPSDVQLAREGVGSFFKKAFTGDDILVGDPRFDQDVMLYAGNAPRAIALFDAKARDAARSLLALPATVNASTLRYRKVGHLKTADELVGALETLRAFADATRSDAPIPTLLARRAAGERLASARYVALETLLNTAPRSDAARDAARAALADASPALRLLAAPWVGDDAAVGALVPLVEDAGLSTTDRLRAARLIASMNPEHGLLRERQAWLVGCLDEESGAALAANTLGDFAGVEVVEALLAHTSGLFKDGALKSAARDAIASIQARASGSRGELSLADTEGAGALALAEE